MILKILGCFVNGLGFGFRTFFGWSSRLAKKGLFSGVNRHFSNLGTFEFSWDNLLHLMPSQAYSRGLQIQLPEIEVRIWR